MKKVLALILVALTCSTATLFAQDKFGHIDSDQLLRAMPETAQAQQAIQEHTQLLETQLQAMYGEYQSKMGEFQANEVLMTEVVKEAKIKEIQDLEMRIQQFQQSSQESIQLKIQEIQNPLLKTVHEVVHEVAEENGYTYVFDISKGAILYWKEDSHDILPLVKTKLGIQ